MPEKRKDPKGRVLRDGETYRKDGRYMYRYTDIKGQRCCIYSHSLNELREQEKQIQLHLNAGVSYASGAITVSELAERYISQKLGVRYNTRKNYNFILNLLKKEEFGYLPIRDIRPSEAKAFCIKLHKDGKSYSTVAAVRGVLKPAFEMAADDEIIRRNPFLFRVADVVPNDAAVRKALSPEEKERFLEYVLQDKCRKRHYNEIVILLGTGLRVSELYGLTKSDIDFENRKIRIERQLTRDKHCEYYIEPPKTKSGTRFIPMSDAVYQALMDTITNRKTPRVEQMIDGCAGFLFLDKEGKPKVALHLEHALKRMIDKYNASHDALLPPITPHVLRHTFCTELANAGMDIKSLQYLMGHSDVDTTLNIYTHSSYETAAQAFGKVESAKDKGVEQVEA